LICIFLLLSSNEDIQESIPILVIGLMALEVAPGGVVCWVEQLETVATFMIVVREVYGDGHDGLSREGLEYIRDMANRVGFERIDDGSEPVALIRLSISMDNPVFRVRLERDAPD
jgi:hypothetical protein